MNLESARNRLTEQLRDKPDFSGVCSGSIVGRKTLFVYFNRRPTEPLPEVFYGFPVEFRFTAGVPASKWVTAQQRRLERLAEDVFED